MTKYIVANWKANKTEKETVDWFREMTSFEFTAASNLEIIACLPYVFLPIAKKEIVQNKLQIKLGAQNVSRFEEGPYTGVVTAGMLEGLVTHVMIGHSERRKLLKETDELILDKIKLSREHHLSPIVCVSNLDQVKFLQKEFTKGEEKESSFFLYEPIEAIGSGKSANPEEMVKVSLEIKKIVGQVPFLYGGSVTSDNVISYLSCPEIDGVAVGGASLDPLIFLKIITNALKA